MNMKGGETQEFRRPEQRVLGQGVHLEGFDHRTMKVPQSECRSSWHPLRHLSLCSDQQGQVVQSHRPRSPPSCCLFLRPRPNASAVLLYYPRPLFPPSLFFHFHPFPLPEPNDLLPSDFHFRSSALQIPLPRFSPPPSGRSLLSLPPFLSPLRFSAPPSPRLPAPFARVVSFLLPLFSLLVYSQLSLLLPPLPPPCLALPSQPALPLLPPSLPLFPLYYFLPLPSLLLRLVLPRSHLL
mmetsp:Transcript_3766/g.6564  ORF Transcript_3766/g.6564 Transcript_3766/m.6564 type:complete len:238 (+) Transcript_3766:132-845(+)